MNGVFLVAFRNKYAYDYYSVLKDELTSRVAESLAE